MIKILHPASMQMCCKVASCTTSCAGVPLGPLSRSVQPIFLFLSHTSAIVADETGAKTGKDTVYHLSDPKNQTAVLYPPLKTNRPAVSRRCLDGAPWRTGKGKHRL